MQQKVALEEPGKDATTRALTREGGFLDSDIGDFWPLPQLLLSGSSLLTTELSKNRKVS